MRSKNEGVEMSFPNEMARTEDSAKRIFGNKLFGTVSMMIPDVYGNFKKYLCFEIYVKKVWILKSLQIHVDCLLEEKKMEIDQLIENNRVFWCENNPFFYKRKSYNPIDIFKSVDGQDPHDKFWPFMYYIREKVNKEVEKLFLDEDIETRTILIGIIRYRFGLLVDDIEGD